MNFDDIAFAHMLKDYSVFPGLVMQFRSARFVSMLQFNRVMCKCDRIITSVGWKQELCSSPV